jgi:uncharacterized protein YprB with RNaseH-like and TPR domain
MSKMNKEEIKVFLRKRKGYLKEGGRRLKKVLSKKGFDTTIKDCRAAIREVGREISISPVVGTSKPKILFYDIEVSYGLAKAWRPTYKGVIRYDDFVIHPRIICISWKWNDSTDVHTVRWNDEQDDKTILEVFIPELDKADFIVAHNGDKFDLPWLRTRALKHGVPMLPKYLSVDTLKIARYRHKFPSNKLDDLGDYLGLGRKIKTDMSLWDRIILNQDAEALEEMVKYCERDVLLLESVYNKLKEQEFNKVHVGVLKGDTKQTSPHTGSRNLELVKTTTTKAGTIKRMMRDKDTNEFFEFSNTDYKKFIA